MGLKVTLFGFCLVSSLALAAPASNSFIPSMITPAPTPLPQNAWSRVAYPSRGMTDSIGFYYQGCIGGAQALPLDGDGYQVMHPSRNRYYANPELIQYVQDLAITVEAMGSGLLVGDLGQPRGGPMPYGHASHQIGLDVDIWYWTHPEQSIRSLTLDERETSVMQSVLNENGVVDPRKFGREQILKLKMASENDVVQRIFVNPAIKVYLCSTLQDKDLSWLHKLRPWPGHDSHFHVRLHCPAEAKNCDGQAPIAEGNGCTEVLPPRGTLNLENGQGSGDVHESAHQELLEKFFKAQATLPAACLKLLKL